MATLRARRSRRIWTHVRERVFEFSSVKNWKQTPEFGRLDFDDHGELIVELPDRSEAGTKQARRHEGRRVRHQRKRSRAAPATSVRSPLCQTRDARTSDDLESH
jgi:hypothetical protein